MEARLNPLGTDVGPTFVKYLRSANRTVVDSTLPTVTQELVKIRASQINGCGFCVDMHTKDAAPGGVTDEAWANAAKRNDDAQLTALVAQIAVINAFNRQSVVLQLPAGDYRPGSWAKGPAGARLADRATQPDDVTVAP